MPRRRRWGQHWPCSDRARATGDRSKSNFAKRIRAAKPRAKKARLITVAECNLLLPLSLTKRLVNHTRPSDITESYAADWSIDQLHESAQRIPDQIDSLLQLPS